MTLQISESAPLVSPTSMKWENTGNLNDNSLANIAVLFHFLFAGMMWSECKELWLEGPREYILQLWNVLDFGMLSIFIAAFTARLLAFLQATKAQQYVDNYIEENDLSEVTLPPEIEYFTYGELSFSHKHI